MARFCSGCLGNLHGPAPAPAVAPFDVDQAKRHQETWAKHLGLPVEWTNSIGMKLVLIPPGEFMMGSPESDEYPVVNVSWNDAVSGFLASPRGCT